METHDGALIYVQNQGIRPFLPREALLGELAVEGDAGAVGFAGERMHVVAEGGRNGIEGPAGGAPADVCSERRVVGLGTSATGPVD